MRAREEERYRGKAGKTESVPRCSAQHTHAHTAQSGSGRGGKVVRSESGV